MDRRPTQKQVFDELLTLHKEKVSEAFLSAIAELSAGADLPRLVAALQARDIGAVIEALNLDPAAYNGLLETIRTAFMEGGQTSAALFPRRDSEGAPLSVRFDGRNEGAETWLHEHSAKLVTRLHLEQQAALRAAVAAGLERGVGPRTIALDIVGRTSRATGRREGGIIGLSAQQEEYARSARAELTSGDAKALRHYLTRERRDRRFDRSVTKAIESGKPMPADVAQRAVAQYRNRLLALRGEVIGRVETMTALQRAKFEAHRQAVAAGKIAETAVRKIWRSAGDFRVRHTHHQLNGESVGLNAVFRSPSGALMLFPMDTSHGAGADEIIGCRCNAEYRIDHLANVI